jgi:uncharacterized protein involved in outer membrane biogenesis
MVKKAAIAVGILAVILAAGLFFWARAVFSNDGVRAALADQLAKALGQPVTIGSVGTAIYPRVTLTLTNVEVGQPARIRVQALDVGTDFRALLSRRIEHAALHLNGARIELPLPPLKILARTGESKSGAADSNLPVQLVSIDEVVLNGVEVVSGGRTLSGDIDLAPHGNAVTVRKIALTAADTTINAKGEITDITGPIGELALTAGTLNTDKLLAFADEFMRGSGLETGSAAPSSGAVPGRMNLTVSLDADRATMGSMSVEKLVGRAVLQGDSVTLQPLAFNLFGGRYEGTIRVGLGAETPTFHWKAGLSGVDVAAAAAFAGSPNTISGRLAGMIDLAGSGSTADTAIKNARGTARVDITNGVVNDLGLVRAVVAATSLDANAVKQAATGSRDEPFSRLGATLSIASGSASTQDLRFESNDLTLNAAGALKLDGSAVDFKGQIQLSDELSKQTGATFARLTAEGGRVTLPVSVVGTAGSYAVKVDVAGMAQRALKNEAAQQGEKLLKRGLGGLIKRP